MVRDGISHWSLSAYVKMRVKDAVSFIGKFEEAIVKFAEQDGVLCGHIHSPAIRKINALQYYNSGDWVETRSALVEHFDGEIELITDYQATPGVEEEDTNGASTVSRLIAGTAR